MTATGAELPTVFLHIGTPKSGTTYLQSRLEVNRRLAGDQGLMWPGPRWGVQVEAVRELRALDDGKRLRPDGPWMRLVESAHSWTGPRALISMEWMAGCSSHQIQSAVQSLRPSRVEVVCTTRDLLRMFVAQWQEMTKNCRPWSWQQFVDEMVGDEPGPASHRFWRQQDVPVILQRWAEQVPWDRFHLVTVPPSGSNPEILWDRFCSVLGLEGAAFTQPPRTNESIGVVSASLMHRINLVALEEGLDRVEYQRMLHRRLADEVLAPRRTQEASIAVSPDVDAWIRTRAQQQVADIRTLDLRVVGDLDELLPGPPLEGREPPDVSDSELLDTSVAAIVKYAIAQDAVIRQLREDNQSLRRRSRKERRSGGTSPQPTDSGPARREAAAGLIRRSGRLGRRGVSRVARAVLRR